MTYLEETKDKILKMVNQYFALRPKKEFIPGETKVQYSGPVFGEQEVKAVLLSLLDGWMVIGKRTREFEKMFADYIGAKGCVTVNSGSSALLVAWSALKNQRLSRPIEDGSEVITTALTHPATINCLLQNNLLPVLVDINPDTLNLDPSLVKTAISKKTRAILPLHFLGNPCDMDVLREIADKHDVFIVEDCCDAYGSEYNNLKVGVFGDMSVVSFYAAHTITMGEGGAVLYKNERFEPILKSLRGWGVACASCQYSPCRVSIDPAFKCPGRFQTKIGLEQWDRRHLFIDIGYNLKIVEMQAAFGIEQLKRLPSFIAKRRENWEYIVKSLEDYRSYVKPQEPTQNSKPAWFSIAFIVSPRAPFTRHDIIQWLEKHKIETRLFFAGDIRDQPAYKNVRFKVVGDLEHTRYVKDYGFFIGCYPGITQEMLEYVVNTFKNFFKRFYH